MYSACDCRMLVTVRDVRILRAIGKGWGGMVGGGLWRRGVLGLTGAITSVRSHHLESNSRSGHPLGLVGAPLLKGSCLRGLARPTATMKTNWFRGDDGGAPMAKVMC